MFDSAEKFNAPKSPAQERPHQKTEVISSQFEERKEPLTKNEQRVLDNLTKTAAWFNKSIKELDDKRANPDIATYLGEFESAPLTIERPAEEKEVMEMTSNSDLVFLGDYHHLSKSQDFVAETIEKISQTSTRPSVLAVEFIECSKSDRKALDEYMSGKIDEEKFLKKIKFKDWDNPGHWPAYKHILESAKKSGIKVCGINTDRKEKNLEKTDEKIAANIQEVLRGNPESRILVHIGEDHLSENHLPEKLASLGEFKQKKSTTIFQNLPSVYFDALKRYKDFHIPKSFKLQAQNPTYNLITAPLVTKLVADIEYLQLNEGYGDEIDLLTADTSYELVKRIVNTLKLKKRKDKYDCVPPAFSSESEIERVLEIFKRSKLAEILNPYFKILDQKGSVYIPGSKDGRYELDAALIIKRFRLKKVLEELAKFIANPDKKVEDFARLSPPEQKNLQAFQYLCSKVFIPERSPSSEEGKEGEKMFRDFLAGKKIEAPNL